MAKMRRQRLLLNKNAYPGCLAGFVSIFDFRQGHSTRHLISDHRQKNVGPPLAPSGDRKKPTTSLQKHEPAAERASIDEEESRAMATLDTVMITSVKALMEEDQWSKVLKPKKKLSDFVLKQIKQNLVLHEAYWKSSKKDKKSEMVGQIFPLIEEFCTGSIYCRFLLSNQDNLRKQLHLKSSVLRERLREALEVFLSKKYMEAYELADIVGSTQPSDALMNAIQVMHTHKDFILRIIQDSSSILFKHIQGLQNAQADKAYQTDSCKELSTHSLLDGWIINRGLLKKCVSQKPKGGNHKLFGQKDKKKNEKICSISDDSSHQIVILKPRQSSTESRPSVEKTRMKMKSAIQEGRKERHWLFVGNIPCNNNISDSANLQSMSRTNYTSALANVKGDKDSMPKDRQSLEDSIFYTEVRKKLLEILKEDDEENLISMNDHKMLGRIISSPDNTKYCHEFSPPGSMELSSQTACTCSCESTQSKPANYALPLKTEVSNREKVGDLNTKSDPVIEINSVEDAARESDQTEDDIRGMKTLISEQSNSAIGAQRERDESLVTDNSDQEVTVRSDEIVVEKINSMLVQPALFSASFIQTDGTDSEDKITEKPEKLSLNSVLEPFSSEDDSNPANSPDKIDKLHILPQMVHFEEDDSFIQDDSTSLVDVCLRNNGEEKDATFGYIKNLLLASGLNYKEIEVTWQSTHAPMDPSLMDQVVAPSSQIPEYRKLLFDCVNEVLSESYIHLFGCCPWLSFVKRGIQPIPTGQQLMEKVAEIVASYLVVHQGLNQTVEKDMAKNKLWMDLRFDAEDVAFQIGHSILDKLMEETILELWD